MVVNPSQIQFTSRKQISSRIHSMKRTITKALAIEKIKKNIEAIDSLKGKRYDNSDFKIWRRRVEADIRNIFSDQRHLDDLKEVRFDPTMASLDDDDSQYQTLYIQGLEDSKAILLAMVEEISEYWPHEHCSVDPDSRIAPEQNDDPKQRKVFIIHGHDEGIKQAVARFISMAGYYPIILHEQASASLTIIEKFERHSNSCFAIALLTPDDVGRSVKDETLRTAAKFI